MRRALKAPLALLALALSLLAFGAVPAAASTPCWQRVINDWYDGRIDKTYPIACYQQAIQHLPPDVQSYTGAADQIQRAMLDAIRHDQRDLGGPALGGGGGGGNGGGPSALGGGTGGAPKGFIERILDRLGPSNAGSVPLPLLVLGAIALLLLTAAGASFVAKRIQARRMLPAPAPAPARPKPEN